MQVTNRGGIKAQLFSLEHGLQVYENIDLIRIKSLNCHLLIMYDHLPILGNIEGILEIVSQDDNIHFDDIHGYFMFKNNCFEFIVKE